MRIGVVGAGAVGGAIAAVLDRAGHRVEVTTRGENLAAIREHGLRLDGGWGEHVARIAASERLGAPPELALLTTKAQDAGAAIRANAAHLGGIPVVVVQNGLGGTDVAHRLLPASPILGGIAMLAASYLSPGRVTVTNPKPVLLGAGPGCDDATLELVAAALERGLPIERTRDLTGAQWTKLLVNHVNAMPAITGTSVQDVVARPRLRGIMAASLRESAGIATAIGIRFADLPGLPAATVTGLDVGREPAERFLLELARGMGEVPNPASTLQSIRRGQPTEIDFLNGAVVAAAAANGMDAPVNAALVRIVHEVERTGRHLDEDEIVARLGPDPG